MGTQQRERITEALAVAAYHARPDGPVVDTLVCDDAPPFRLVTEALALCWVHQRRDLKKLVDYGGQTSVDGDALLALHHAVFAAWHRFRRGETDRAELQQELAPLQAQMRTLLEAGAAHGGTKLVGVSEGLLKLWPALWTFASVEAVEPTNNAAERALRPAVLWRKGSCGSHSGDGSRYAERLLTTTASCRQQCRNVLEFLVEAIRAHHRGTTPPSTLPPRLAQLAWTLAILLYSRLFAEIRSISLR